MYLPIFNIGSALNVSTCVNEMPRAGFFFFADVYMVNMQFFFMR